MCKNDEKTSLRIRRYFSNLTRALFGNDPFLSEKEKMMEQLRKSAENMSALQDQLYSALDKWDRTAKMLEDSHKRESGLERLVENLRERLADKDRMIGELEKQLMTE